MLAKPFPSDNHLVYHRGDDEPLVDEHLSLYSQVKLAKTVYGPVRYAIVSAEPDRVYVTYRDSRVLSTKLVEHLRTNHKRGIRS